MESAAVMAKLSNHGAVTLPVFETTVRDQTSEDEEQKEQSNEDHSATHCHLADKIRAERQELEQKIQNLKNHINTCSKVMKELKKRPGGNEKYESLTKTRASLVTNAVHLQQLLKQLQQSESQADQLADREKALSTPNSHCAQPASTPPQTGCDTASANGTTCESQAALSPLAPSAEINGQTEAETKEQLMKRIHNSQTQLRIMENQQQKLRAIKEEIQRKLVISKNLGNGNGSSESGEKSSISHSVTDTRDHSATTNAPQWPPTRSVSGCWPPAEDRSSPPPPGAASCRRQAAAVAAVAEGVAPPPSPPGRSQLPGADELHVRLAALHRRRSQLDQLLLQLASVQQQQQLAPSDTCHQPPTVGDVVCDSAWSERNGFDTLTQHRQRLQQLEQTLEHITKSLQPDSSKTNPAEPSQLPSSAAQQQQQQQQPQHQPGNQKQSPANARPQDTLQHVTDKKQEMEHTRRQLSRAKRLMSVVETARARGQRLSTCVPDELTELLCQHHIDTPPCAPKLADNGHKQASEYVQILRNMADSVDHLQEMKQLHTTD